MKMKRIAGLAGAALLLVGCGASAESADPSREASQIVAPSPTPSVVKDARYGSVTELRDALVLAGYPCPEWKQENRVELAAESGECSSADVLSTFATQTDLDQFVDNWRGLGDFSNPILVGPNWVLNIPEDSIDQVRPVLGGTKFS